MARKERNDVDYFPHTVNHGKKMFFIENKYGNDGYATWFKVLEELSRASYHYLNLNDDMTMMFLSSTCRVSIDRLEEILSDLERLGEFDSYLFENKILFNERFVGSVEDAYKKRNNSCINKESLLPILIEKGVLNVAKGNPNKAKSTLKGAGNPQSKVKETKVEESREGNAPAPLNYSFDEFWDLYDKKVGEKAKNEKKWNNLTNVEREAIMAYVPKYKIAEPDKGFRKNAETFLNNRSWEDEIIIKGQVPAIKQQGLVFGTPVRKIDHSHLA